MAHVQTHVCLHLENSSLSLSLLKCTEQGYTQFRPGEGAKPVKEVIFLAEGSAARPWQGTGSGPEALSPDLAL